MEHKKRADGDGVIMYLLVAYQRGDEAMVGMVLKPEELGARSMMIEEGKDTGIELSIEVGTKILWTIFGHSVCRVPCSREVYRLHKSYVLPADLWDYTKVMIIYNWHDTIRSTFAYWHERTVYGTCLLT